MPGIFGLITKMPRAWAEPQFLRMLKVLRHESFYETGTWIDERPGLRRMDGARELLLVGMPLRNEQGDVVLVFAGEEYSDPANIRPSARTWPRIPADGPSYLVHLYEADPFFPKMPQWTISGAACRLGSRDHDAVQ
jgi:hypothetical protein